MIRCIAIPCCIAVWLAASPAAAATFSVTNTANSGIGSLRQAVLDANAAPGADVVTFAIPGSGPHVIALQTSALDSVGPLMIDGLSQAGAIANSQTPEQGGLNGLLKVMLVPTASSSAPSAIRIAAGEVTLRGLVISGFGNSAGVSVAGTSTVASIEGCIFGTDASGNAAYAPAGQRGLFVSQGRVRVGGQTPMQRNLFAGHSNDAIQLHTASASGSIVEGNLFGTSANGIAAIGNGSGGGGYALHVRAASTATLQDLRVGGTATASRNVFAAGFNSAIRIACTFAVQAGCVDGLLIQGNYIGTDANGVHALPNGSGCPIGGCSGAAASGIDVSGLTLGLVVVGGSAPGAGNLIAFNRGGGIGWDVTAGTVIGSLEILGNSLAYNTGSGIRLRRASTSMPNDPNDVDEGPNRFQNTPVIESAVLSSSGTELEITYRIDTAVANADYPLRADFYRSSDGEEGDDYLGSDEYPAAAAQTSRTVVMPLPPGGGLPLVATATDAQGHTSQFSLGDLIFRDDFELE